MITTKDNKVIKLVFVSGTDAQGKPVRKTQMYKQVNSQAATTEKVYNFGQAVAQLTEWPLEQILLVTDQDITNV